MPVAWTFSIRYACNSRWFVEVSIARPSLYALIFRTDLFASRFCFSTEINSDFLRRICKGAADADDTGVALGLNFKGVRSNRGIHYEETQASCFGRRESSSTSGYNPFSIDICSSSSPASTYFFLHIRRRTTELIIQLGSGSYALPLEEDAPWVWSSVYDQLGIPVGARLTFCMVNTPSARVCGHVSRVK